MSSISGLSSSSALGYASKLFTKMDTDSSGSISEEEFTSAQSVSESKGKHKSHGQVSNLDDSMMQALLQSGMNANTSSVQPTNAEDMIAAMDTDGDGTITKEEFITARPNDVTEEMAANLWKQFDTEGTGSLSTDDLQVAMAESRPAGGPPPMGPPTSSDDDDDEEDLLASADGTDPFQTLIDELLSNTASTESTDTTSATTSNTALQAFLEAVKAYDATAGYDATKNVLSSLMALA